MGALDQVELPLLLALELSVPLSSDESLLQLVANLGVHDTHNGDGQHVLEDHRDDRVDSTAMVDGPGLDAEVDGVDVHQIRVVLLMGQIRVLDRTVAKQRQRQQQGEHPDRGQQDEGAPRAAGRLLVGGIHDDLVPVERDGRYREGGHKDGGGL